MGSPVLPHEPYSVIWQWHIPVLCALAPVDMDKTPCCVYIAGFEMERFLEPQATGIDGCQENIVVEGVDPLEDAVYLLPGQDGWQSSFGLCLEDVEDVPVSPDDMGIEELDCAVGDSQGIGECISFLLISAKKLSHSGLKPQAERLLDILREDPYHPSLLCEIGW